WKAGWQVVFYPGARAIHDRGKTTAPYPVHFALAQQRSVLYYWKKHHGPWGQLGIRTIMLFRHVTRYAAGVARSIADSRTEKGTKVRKAVSGACLRELLGGHVLTKA
ncbi:MAG TPA: hypothetical protein VGX94_17125, partial [Terriglobia bacterium]|nr:hypothetical protein [Terriglobia bacterium]